MTREPAGFRGLRTAAAALGVCVGYYVGAHFGFLLRFPPMTPSVMWPPNAILTTALLLAPPRHWWIYLFAALPAHLAAELGAGWPTSLVLILFATNCSEALFAACGVRWLSDTPTRFDTLRRVVVFIIAAVIVAPFLSSFLDAAAVAAVLREPYWSVWQTRLFSNALTELTVVPALVIAATRGSAWPRPMSLARTVEAACLGALLLIAGIAVFTGSAESGTLSGQMGTPFAVVLPFMLWAAVRFGPGGASSALLTTALLSIWGATHGRGPLGTLPIAEGVLPLQIFLITIAIPLMCLAALIEERRRAEDTLGERLRFEQMLSNLSASFVNLPGHSMDGAFEIWLRQLGEFLRIDHVLLFQFAGDGEELVVASTWTDPEVRHRFEDSGEAPTQGEPWHQLVLFSPAAEPPLEPVRDPGSRAGLDVRSSLTIPLEAGGEALGALWLGKLTAERTWSNELVQRLRLVAGVFASALARRKADNALRTSEGMKSAILASLPSRVAVLDREGRIIAVNESWIRRPSEEATWDARLGVGANYVATCRHLASAAVPFVQVALAGVERVLDGSRASFALEYACGDPVADRWFAMSVVPLNRHQGGAVISHTDVTERKLAEIDAERSRRDLAHFTRRTTIGELTASLAHELNQPLTGILTNAEAAQRFLHVTRLDRDELRSIMWDVIQDAKRAGDVIKRLRDFLGKGEPEAMPLDLNALIQGVTKLVSSDAVIRNVTVTLDLDPNLPLVTGDSVQLQQVVLNLMLNAMEAIGEGECAAHRLVVRTDCPDTESVRVAVEDSGPGLRDDTQEQIFEPFFTTKRDGMGMGLAIARSIIEAHGGVIWATNNAGGGATFHFIVPLVGAPAA